MNRDLLHPWVAPGMIATALPVFVALSACPGGYAVPTGGLYRGVSCPNFLGELVECAGWALLTWSGAGAAFNLLTLANLAPRAMAHHRGYRATFPDWGDRDIPAAVDRIGHSKRQPRASRHGSCIVSGPPGARMRPFALLLLPLVACGVDSASANGELGRMTFTLVSDYYVADHDITENAIVTGHEQGFSVDLTGQGEDDAGKQADEISYVMVPDDGVTVSQSGPDADSGDDDGDSELVSSFSLTVADPGEYQLEARLAGETFDRIHLFFDAPAALDLALFVRDPWETEFVAIENSGTLTMEEGAQLAWLPIPVDNTGGRLLGDLEADMTADPQTAVVPAANVDHVNEDEVETFFGAPSLYFVEPGEVTVTVTDTVNPAAGNAAFEVGAMVL